MWLSAVDLEIKRERRKCVLWEVLGSHYMTCLIPHWDFAAWQQEADGSGDGPLSSLYTENQLGKWAQLPSQIFCT